MSADNEIPKDKLMALGAMQPEDQLEWVTHVSLRRHGVDLERVQRIHLDIDSEPMEFTAKTIASMIQDIANVCDEHEAFLLHAVVRALEGRDSHHELILKQKKPGRWRSPAEHDERHALAMSCLHWLARLEREGMKTEAAVAEIASAKNMSRASIFAAVKEAEDFLELGRTLDLPKTQREGREFSPFENPRPNKKGNT